MGELSAPWFCQFWRSVARKRRRQRIRPPSTATLAIVNARVWTGDPAKPWAEALAVRARPSRWSARTRKSAAAPDRRRRSTPAVDSSPPDSSIRTFTSSTAASACRPCSCATRARARSSSSRIKSFAATLPAGAWITGGDWDHTLWGGELPTREWIDAVTPDHPVWINRLDGHMALANSAALRAAGVTRATEGGRGRRDRPQRRTASPRAC